MHRGCWLIAAWAGATVVAAQDAPRHYNILFVGNSLTYVNDFPGTMSTLCDDPQSPIRVSSGSSVMGGAILRDHCFDPSEYADYPTNIPHTIQAIRDGPGGGGHWDFVMIQDQSGSWFQLGVDMFAHYGFDEHGGHYRLYADILSNETRAQGGEPVFLMTWRDGGPEDLTPELQGEVDDCYSYAASMENALCAPCGLAALINADSYRSQIYVDEVHPTALTQYTNACVFYALLTNRSPVGLGGSVDGANVTLLQENAWRAYTEYKATRSAECTPERCIRFFDDDFNLNVVPTMTTTTQTTVTTHTTPLPPVETCELPADAPTEISLAESVVINGAMPAATVAPLFDRLGDVCPTVWQPCYSGSRVHWGATFFHHCCDEKGPTLTVIRAGGRVFGGFAPVSWDSHTPTQSTRGRGGWLFRLNPDTSQLDFANLTSRSSTVMHDAPGFCVWLGKWEDLKLGSDCRSATGNFVFTGYIDPPAGFGDTWLAGNTSWVADEVEVYYVPELANASSPRCTLAAPSQPPTTAVPTTAAPTYDGETLSPTAAPSSSAPSASPTPAPATGAPTASPEGSPPALGILQDMKPRITAIDAAQNPYRGFLDLRVVRGGTMHSPATVWSAVCGTSWTEVNSQVACRQMGLRGGQTLSCPDCVIDGRPVVSVVDNFACNESTRHLRDCSHTSSITTTARDLCGPADQVMIECEAPHQYDLRLTADPTLEFHFRNGGLLEFFLAMGDSPGQWYSVCQNGWDGVTGNRDGHQESKVACEQLGYTAGILSPEPITHNASAILLGSVACTNTSIGLAQCSHASSRTCAAGPVAVVCSGFAVPTTTPSPTLTGETYAPTGSAPTMAPTRTQPTRSPTRPEWWMPTSAPQAASASPPTTAVPTTPAPTAVGETFAPTTAPSSSAPSAPNTPAPATEPFTATPTVDRAHATTHGKTDKISGVMLYGAIGAAVLIAAVASVLFYKGFKMSRRRKAKSYSRLEHGAAIAIDDSSGGIEMNDAVYEDGHSGSGGGGDGDGDGHDVNPYPGASGIRFAQDAGAGGYSDM